MAIDGNYCKTAGGSVKTTIDAFCAGDDDCTSFHCGTNGECTPDVDPRSCERSKLNI